MATQQVSSRKRMRHLSDEQCKKAAARIAGELKDYAKHLDLWERSTPHKCIAPMVPIWGPDLETVKVKVERLYHPDEAKIIIAALTA